MFIVSTFCFAQGPYFSRIEQFSNEIVDRLHNVRAERIAIINIRETFTENRTVFSDILEEDLINDLIQNNQKTFSLVSVRMDEVLNELRNQNNTLFDREQREKFGRLAGADAILTGRYQLEREFVFIKLQLLSINTGEAIAAFDFSLPLLMIPKEFLSPRLKIAQDNLILGKKRGQLRWYATWRSLLLPGWGQHFNGYSTKGTLFFITEVALAGATYYTWDQKSKKTGDDQQQKYQDYYKYSSSALVLVHSVNVLDALIFPAKNPVHLSAGFFPGSNTVLAGVKIKF